MPPTGLHRSVNLPRCGLYAALAQAGVPEYEQARAGRRLKSLVVQVVDVTVDRFGMAWRLAASMCSP